MAEADLTSPADFRLLFENAPGSYLVLDPELTIIAVTNSYARATLTRREDIVGRPLFEVFPDNPGDPNATGIRNLRASLDRVLRTSRQDTMAVQKYDIRRPAHEGGGFEVRYWSPVNSPVLDPEGRVVFIIHRVEDVTEYVLLKHGDSSGPGQSRFIRDSGRIEAEIYRRAQEIQEANGKLRDLQQSLEARVGASEVGLQRTRDELARQIAERQRAENALRQTELQFRQAQRLEAVGRLAGGVAHDFNNLLSIILSLSEVLCTDLPEDAPGRDELEQIHRAGVRAADLTRQLLAFSRRQVMETRLLDLNAVVREVQRMLGRVLGEDIELRLVAAPDLGRVRADPGQLEQVVMNLVVNARDAMPTGGSLTLATANVEIDDSGEPDHIGLPAGHYVQLSVTDTGMGMDKATQARIFEPFFTTKEVGKGTGLGLSTVFGIVKQSGGHIWVYSEPGAGATFKVFLPRAEGDLVAARTQAPAVGPGTETILVVDDDDQIRAIVARILRRSGYQVLEAAGAKDALAVSERHPAEIHLLLCDVVMPEMNGRLLGEHVALARPGIKQLYMSGYTDDALLHHGVLDAGLAFLQKPITPAALCRKVRAVLDGDSERRPPS